jgi:hypothetical protein
MYRSLALLVLPLPLLIAGCGSSSRSANSAPPPTIDSYRSSYFSGKQLPPPPQQDQVAAMPVPADPAGGDPGNGPSDQADAAPAPAAAAHKPASAPAYKASVAAYIKRYAVDSNSLKQAKIGTPFQGAVNGQKGSVVCVELGGISTNRTAYLLKDNDVADSEFGAAACHDKKLQPWDNTGA